jgi:hypothetical protein
LKTYSCDKTVIITVCFIVTKNFKEGIRMRIQREREIERKRQTDRVRHTHTGKETWDEKAEME